MDNRPIGIFDSGVGGLTVVKECMKILPGEDIVYFGDTGRVPYGTRSRETILKYARDDARFLLTQDVKMIIVACGTVSSVLSDEFTRTIPVPITGVVGPSAQAACSLSRGGRIGVIGTSATVKSGSYGKAIRAIRPDAAVVGNACPLFVPLVENGMIEQDNQVTRLVAQQYLAPMKAEAVDTLILGCTHFPALYNMINELLDYKVTLIDSGKVTAEYARNFLSSEGMLSDRAEGKRRYFVTDQPEGFISTAEKFLGVPVDGDVTYIDLDQLQVPGPR